MTFQAKLVLVGIVGLCIILVTCIAGCGGVNLAGLDTPDASPPDASGAAGHDALTMQADGAAGTGGRPLAAGCSADDQCGSGICAATLDGAKMCCDGRPDVCTQCVGGYKVPLSNGTGCGSEMCDGTDRKWDLCMDGVCSHEVVHCAAALCDKAGNRICPGGGVAMAGCAIEDNPCFCYDAAGASHVSYPCPQVAPPCVSDACGSCVNGVRVPAPDGISCGVAACSGVPQPTGFSDGSSTYPTSDSHVCRAGVCTTWTTDCSTITCAPSCALKYRGCGTSGVCWCVDTGGSVCP